MHCLSGHKCPLLFLGIKGIYLLMFFYTYHLCEFHSKEYRPTDDLRFAFVYSLIPSFIFSSIHVPMVSVHHSHIFH